MKKYKKQRRKQAYDFMRGGFLWKYANNNNNGLFI